MKISDKINEHKILWWSLVILFGTAVRFIIMSRGHNIDFTNFLVIGEIAAEGKNVYASTQYYNYGPVWFMIAGTIYRLSSFFQNNVLADRIMIVSLLMLVSLLISAIIAKRAGNLWGMLFFLNPFSVFSDGYNNQFDNIAVYLGILGVLYLEKSSHEENISLDDVFGIIFLSLSLITKHVLWAFPLWLLLNTTIPVKKRIFYAFIPPIIFLLSFTPYLKEGWQGILQNVFMYRAANNFPLLGLTILNRYGIFIPFQQNICFVLFSVLMATGAYVFRREDIYHSFLLYTIAVTSASSAIFSHYLVIPVMALLLLFQEKALIYFVLSFIIILDRNLMHVVIVWSLLLYLASYYYQRNKA